MRLASRRLRAAGTDLQTCVISFPYPTCQWTCRHFGKWPPPCTPTRSIVLRRNFESTELHSLTMLQACSQAVDLKVDRHFGEGQEYRNAEATAALREKTA